MGSSTPLAGRDFLCYNNLWLPVGEHLDRLLEPVSHALNPASAKALAEMEADPVAAERVAVLAEKCNEGTLSAAEQREYETYVHAANLLAILKAKARLYLKRHPAS